MAGLSDVKAVIVKFFKREFNLPTEAVHVLGITKKGEKWQSMVQITQTNQHLKYLGYPPVFEKEIYTITIDHNLEITSYWLGELTEEED